jgi:hypothetical protein
MTYVLNRELSVIDTKIPVVDLTLEHVLASPIEAFVETKPTKIPAETRVSDDFETIHKRERFLFLAAAIGDMVGQEVINFKVKHIRERQCRDSSGVAHVLYEGMRILYRTKQEDKGNQNDMYNEWKIGGAYGSGSLSTIALYMLGEDAIKDSETREDFFEPVDLPYDYPSEFLG